MKLLQRVVIVGLFVSLTLSPKAGEVTTILDLWTETPPGPAIEQGVEKDFTKPTDKLIAGRRIIKLGNVSNPQVHVYRPSKALANGTAVIVCPGGGWSILAWDLEGTEVAEWLNSVGVTALVLKYRVPTRNQEPRWLAPVQDAQRAVRLARFHAEDWNLAADRIGVLGFSAGGHTAAMAAVLTEATYDARDSADAREFRPNFAALIYPGGLLNEDNSGLHEDVSVSAGTPPVFFAHAFDDRVRPENSLLLALALKKANVPCELHLYSEGGHGYGLRETEQPVTGWAHACARWMTINGWLKTD